MCWILERLTMTRPTPDTVDGAVSHLADGPAGTFRPAVWAMPKVTRAVACRTAWMLACSLDRCT